MDWFYFERSITIFSGHWACLQFWRSRKKSVVGIKYSSTSVDNAVWCPVGEDQLSVEFARWLMFISTWTAVTCHEPCENVIEAVSVGTTTLSTKLIDQIPAEFTIDIWTCAGDRIVNVLGFTQGSQLIPWASTIKLHWIRVIYICMWSVMWDNSSR